MKHSLSIAFVTSCLALVSASTVLAQTAPTEEAVILTPKAPPTPRINGAKVFGVRPNHPFLFTVPATGDRPMTFSAEGLPAGLKIDSTTGHITGMLAKEGSYTVKLGAKNAAGSATRDFKIVCGPDIGLTPAMGWNSWNCFASAVTQDHVKAAADAMVATGLINHGWTYVNIDDYWEVNRRRTNDETLQGIGRDDSGKIVPNPRFPDMKGLCDYVHGLGLKMGIYSGPGPTTCGGCIASWEHELQDAQSYGDWGFDYLKYDWCSYSSVIPAPPAPPSPPPVIVTNMMTNDAGVVSATYTTNNPPRRRNNNNYDLPTLKKPYEVMRAALDKVPRDIMFSLCQYGWGNVWEWGATVGGNSWRTTGDITDTWQSLRTIGFGQAGHEKYAGPGHFNDPDMMIVGKVGWGPRLHPTRLTPNEQYTHVSLWCLLSSPLLIGCDMTAFDDFTLSLLSNDEVLAVDQDSLGKQAGRVSQDGTMDVWAKDLDDGSKAVGLFNRGDEEATITAKWSDLGLTGKRTVRDLWRQSNLGTFENEFQAKVARHGVVLVKVTPQ